MQAVGYGLCVAWAVAAVAASVSPGLAGQWQLAAGALTGAIGLTAARLGSQPPPGSHGLARAVATIAGPLVIAASVQFVLAAPDGRLTSQARRTTATAGYLAALATGLLLAVTGHQFPAPRPW